MTGTTSANLWLTKKLKKWNCSLLWKTETEGKNYQSPTCFVDGASLPLSCFFSLPFFFSPDGHGQFKASCTEKNPNIIYFLNVPMTYTCLYKRVLCVKMAKTSPYLWSYTGPRQKFIPLAAGVWTLGTATKVLPGQQHHRGQGMAEEPLWGLQHVPGSGSSRRWSTRPPQFCLELWDRWWEITQAGEKQCGRGHGKMSSFLH